MIKILFFLRNVGMCFIILYFCFSFITWEFDASKWYVFLELGSLTRFVCLVIIIANASYAFDNDKEITLEETSRKTNNSNE